MNFSKYPILRGLVPYIAGFFLACYLQTFVFNYLIIIVLALFFLFLSYLLLCKFFPSLRFVSSAVFFLLFLSVGFVFTCKKKLFCIFFPKAKKCRFFRENGSSDPHHTIKKGKNGSSFCKSLSARSSEHSASRTPLYGK